jgi:anti-sigma factor RsiW
MRGCLGEVAAALVDGELDHADRERAQRHLAHCDTCRAEVDAQRRLKARMAGLEGPGPSVELQARLLGIGAPATGLETRLPGTGKDAARPAGPVRPASLRPAARGAAATRPASRRAVRRRRAATGTVLAALGVAAALALGGTPSRPPSTPVDPGTDAFVTEFVDVTNDGTAGTGVTQATLTGGGVGSPR